MKRLTCAVVGCGSIAQVHSQVLNDLDQAELIAFADVKPGRAERLAKTYGGRAYSSLEELLEKESPQVVHLCTPHYLHTPMAKQLSHRGIHVFTEKPPVIDRNQWEEFRTLGEKSRVGICLQNRYNRSVKLLEDVLNSGKPGKLLGARAFVTWSRDAAYYTESGWRGALATEGGGALINQSVHTMDLLVRFLGQPTEVEASISNHHLKGVIQVEDTMEAYISFGGTPALFYATTAHCENSPVFVELTAENAVLRMEEQEVCIRWKDGTVERFSLASPLSPATGKAYWGTSHGLCIGDFYRCLLTGERFPNDIPGVTPTVELMLSAYESAREHRVVTR